MSFRDGTCYYLNQIVENHDKYRIPLSSSQRSNMKGIYRYFGAQGVIDNISKYIFDGTYLLLAEDGENLRSRKENIAQLVHGKFWVNNHAHILKNNHLSDIRFLYYLINNMDLTGYVTGSTIPKLSQSSLSAIKVKIPSLPEQKRISDVLASIDEKIELNNKLNKTLEEMAQAIFKSWFVDFEPFKDEEFIESELGSIPKTWRVAELGEFLKIHSGYAFKGTDYNDKGSYKIVTIKNVEDGKFQKREFSKIDFLPSNLKDYQRINEADILISLTGNVGRTCLAYGEDLLLNQRVGKIEKSTTSGFFYYLLRTEKMRNTIISIARGSAQPNLSVTDFYKIKTILPPQKVILDYCLHINKINQFIIKNNIQNEILESIKDSLLPKLMSGEIRVPLEEVPHAEVR